MAQPHAANKGTLAPGQTISINKYTIQVERYLSQGGFAHVYLVRTPTPVYGTTHHVLKRIAVPNEAMLSEVKKEVDIMRILKGHPNIVHLIDAAWHRMSNGMYEVFILMEFCPGGGIIDMMNRRLRERLTEAEILQIFVDVCEGVAAMHNLRPALLHRDLKVENILQSSATLYKLCDFGSATPVAPRPPSTTQEIRALEADLNRHTTLQYRAPEMVDPYLRRPVDEKSDVWALGVLLYKLCYYTTPFEEHGPLAILNVQYRIPPYPVYSQQMNALIGSMLREHGAQRPTVFEVLNVVHRMRGTKSKFTYDVPARTPLSPRHIEASSQNNPLDSLISYRSSSSNNAPQLQASPVPKNAGVQAREKVLEAIAPMRRGRPTPLQSTSRPSSPTKEVGKENRKATHRGTNNDFEMDFGMDEEDTWKAAKNARGAVRGHRSGLASPDAWKVKHSGFDDAWDIGRTDKDKEKDRDRRKTFQGGLDGGFSRGFGDSFDAVLGSDKPSTKPVSIPSSSAQDASDPSRRYPPLSTSSKSKDAFEGLGLSTGRTPEPTLAEARKARTGLAAPVDFKPSSSPNYSNNLNIPGASSRPPSAFSGRPSPSPQPRSQAPSPVPPPQTTWRPSPQPVQPSGSNARSGNDDFSAEERFPSLEELDRAYQLPDSHPPPHANSQPPQLPSLQKVSPLITPQLPPRPQPKSNYTGGLKPPERTTSLVPNHIGKDGVRSEHVTGAAMRESGRARKESNASPPKQSRTYGRPTLERRHRSSISIKSPIVDTSPPPPAAPSASQILGRTDPQDWLTGDDVDLDKPPGTPVLRDSPSKRASIIERSPVVQSPQEAVAGRHPSPPTPPSPSPSPLPRGYKARLAQAKAAETSAQRAPPKPVDTLIAAPAVKGGPVEKDALTENWSPVTRGPVRKDTASSTSSEEGPEDVNGSIPHGQARKVFEFKEKVGEGKRSQIARAKGRQSSVHDLVDLWGGKKEKDVTATATPAVTGNGLVPRTTGTREITRAPSPVKESEQLKRPPPLSSLGAIRSASPQPIASPAERPESATRTYSPTKPLQRHRKQSTTALSSPPPVSPAVGRSRPQSMFINSPTLPKPTPLSPQVSTTSTTASSLAPPPDPRARRSVRRTSISDMVHRYEAMGGKPIVPATSTKPLTKVATHGTASAALSSAAPASPLQTRSRSQFGPGASLSIPDEIARTQEAIKGRVSPTGLPPRSSPRAAPVGLPSLATDKKVPAVLSGRQSPFRPSQPAGEQRNASALGASTRSAFPRAPSPAPEPADERPASPEKPYQGVGRLIDQWQKKTADGEAPKRGGFGGPGARRTGVVAGRGR